MHFSKRRKYGVIYADPPWSFRNWSAKGTGRNAVSHYDCLDFTALAALPVADLAADDCALFLWATDPLLPRALRSDPAWGFEYKTVAFYWVKLNSGQARCRFFHWPRLLDARQSGAMSAGHAGKPRVEPKMLGALSLKSVANIAASLIACGSGSSGWSARFPYLELFGRETKKGWDCWGKKRACSMRGSPRRDGSLRASWMRHPSQSHRRDWAVHNSEPTAVPAMNAISAWPVVGMT